MITITTTGRLPVYVFLLTVLCLLYAGCTKRDDIEPVLVNVDADIVLNLEWLPYENIVKSKSRSGSDFSRRFIVEVYREDEVVAQHTVFTNDLTGNRLQLSLPVRLRALAYTAGVWMDYVEAGTKSDLFHDTSRFPEIALNTPHTGHTDMRDCAYANVLLDLRPYRDKWNERIQVEVQMERPLAKYQVIATDVEEFRKQLKKKYPDETDLRIRFTYGFYYPTAFNVRKGKPADSQPGVSFDVPLFLPDDGTKELSIGSDHIFVNGAGSYIPVVTELIKSDGTTMGKTKGFNVPYRRGYITTLRGGFLTPLLGSEGIGIDPGFDDDDINIDLDEWM